MFYVNKSSILKMPPPFLLKYYALLDFLVVEQH